MSLVQSYQSWWVTTIKWRGRAERQKGKVETDRDTFYQLLSITYICVVLFWVTPLLHMQSTSIHSNEWIMSIYKTCFLQFLTLLKIQLELALWDHPVHILFSPPLSRASRPTNASHESFLKRLDQSAPGGGSWGSRQIYQKHFIWKRLNKDAERWTEMSMEGFSQR